MDILLLASSTSAIDSLPSSAVIGAIDASKLFEPKHPCLFGPWGSQQAKHKKGIDMPNQTMVLLFVAVVLGLAVITMLRAAFFTVEQRSGGSEDSEGKPSRFSCQDSFYRPCGRPRQPARSAARRRVGAEGQVLVRVKDGSPGIPDICQRCLIAIF